MITHSYIQVKIIISLPFANANYYYIIGVVDGSGLEFFYSNTEPVHVAGMLAIGHNVLPSMIIPPKADNYLIEGFCSGKCTEKVRRLLLLRYDCHIFSAFIKLM